jgi:hypothetical protein
MARGKDTSATASASHLIARLCGRSRFHDPRGFSLIEVQVAIVLFILGMIAFLGYARVNGQLVTSVEHHRSVDGYADLSKDRAIIVIASEAGTTTSPACEVALGSIDTSGPYPIVEVSVARVLP